VIIPATTIQQLSLSDEVVEAVKNEQFFIYQVEDIYQTAKILFDRDLLEEKEEYAKANKCSLFTFLINPHRICTYCL